MSSRYEIQCPTVKITDVQETRSLSANPRKDVLDPLNKYTIAVSKELGRLIIVTGTAFDHNYDGLADMNRTNTASHLYRVLIRCKSEWSSDGLYCKNGLKTDVLAFIFPHMNGDANCMTSEDLLLQYTARLKDVELISGLVFDLPRVPAHHMMYLKLKVVTYLW
ncbi:hypothetical protein DICVIV_03672 [Dictyocaulus viviparus]|uniref:Uncharacterized protein n=1 Tax=Dictyocaulus viviparus TaxID=29172 RepID=A0A0D8Y290_DICVI|nr:hypothetical protein DICVIV_03672 [Dictyocaulus viviparus]